MESVRIPEVIPDLLRQLAKTHADRALVFCDRGNGIWASVSAGKYWDSVHRLAVSLRRVGLKAGDRFAILSRTCLEWQMAEMAGLLAGLVIVGIDVLASNDQINYVIQHSGSSAIFVDTKTNLDRLDPAIRNRLKGTICLEGGPLATDWDWNRLTGAVPAGVDLELPQLSPWDPSTIIYTSGSTGSPKGIEYSHGQIMLACRSIVEEMPEIPQDGVMICWLPMAPLFQRVLNLVGLAKGMQIYFLDDPRRVVDCMAQVSPSVFAAIPRFYEKLYEAIEERIQGLSRVKRWMARRAIRVGTRWSQIRREHARISSSLKIERWLWDQLVLRRMRAAFGTRLEFMITGSAPIATWLLEFFDAIGVLILEAYGLSENTVPMAVNRRGAFRFGSVGKPFATNEIRFGSDGEILVKGAGVFRGYYNESPSDHIDDDGYYHTGDFGRLDDDGFLYLMGRKSDIIKTSAGHRVSPARVENVYSQSPCIDQIVVVGNGRKHLVALVTLNTAAVAATLRGRGIEPPSPEQLSNDPKVKSLIRDELSKCDQRLSRHEQVVMFAILPEPLSLANGDLTPNLKLRRTRIEQKYKDVIDRLFQDCNRLAE